MVEGICRSRFTPDFGWLGCLRILDSYFRGNDGVRKWWKGFVAWFRMAKLFADFWIPDFAGMTG